MEEKKDVSQERAPFVIDEENFIPVEIDKNGAKFLFAIPKGSSLNVAFDAALDVAFFLREKFREQMKQAVEENKNEENPTIVADKNDS